MDTGRLHSVEWSGAGEDISDELVAVDEEESEEREDEDGGEDRVRPRVAGGDSNGHMECCIAKLSSSLAASQESKSKWSTPSMLLSGESWEWAEDEDDDVDSEGDRRKAGEEKLKE